MTPASPYIRDHNVVSLQVHRLRRDVDQLAFTELEKNDIFRWLSGLPVPAPQTGYLL